MGEYHYDDQGFRVYKKHRQTNAATPGNGNGNGNGNGPPPTTTVYELETPNKYFAIERQRNSSGNGNGVIPNTEYAVNNVFLDGVRIAAMIPNGQARWFMTDQVDSVNVVVNDAGDAISAIDYLPYGETWYQTGDTGFSPKYNSQELDKESGLYFFNARHYDPEIARFETADSVVDGEGSIVGWNRYTYVKGNPLKYKDPTGHFGIFAWPVRLVKEFFGGTGSMDHESIAYRASRNSGNGILTSIGHAALSMWTDIVDNLPFIGVATYEKKTHLDGMKREELEKYFKEHSDNIKNNPFTPGIGRAIHAVEDFYSHTNFIQIAKDHYGKDYQGSLPTYSEVLNDPIKYKGLKEKLDTQLESGTHENQIFKGINESNDHPIIKGINTILSLPGALFFHQLASWGTHDDKNLDSKGRHVGDVDHFDAAKLAERDLTSVFRRRNENMESMPPALP